jgi:Bifunctional DNA primase/polymerase, N-terminal
VTGKGVKYSDIKTLVELHGWVIFPTKRGMKFPRIKWEKYQTDKPAIATIESWFPEDNVGGAWLLTQISRVAVLDCDSDEAHLWWQRQIGSAMDTTPRVRTSKGWHYYFTVPEELWDSPELKDRVQSSDETDPEKKWDFRGEGGVIVPPTWHVKGERYYEWDTQDMRPSPAEGLCDFASVEAVLRIFRSGEYKQNYGARVKNSLTDFSYDEAVAKFVKMKDGSGRNNVFKDIAMSAIRKTRDYDFATSMLRPIYMLLEDKTDFDWDNDCVKAIDSAWKTYQQSIVAPTTPSSNAGAAPAQAAASTGYLVPSATNTLLVEVPQRGPGAAFGLDVLTNFNLVAKGVLIDGTKRTYVVDIKLESGEVVPDVALPADTLASPSEWSKFLVNNKAFVYSLKAKRGNFPDYARFSLYLESQNPPEYLATSYLGVQLNGNGGEFITHEGVITKEGLLPHKTVKPSPTLKNTNYAPYHYQFEGSMREALLALAEVLTLHDFITTSLYASRFAALLHKADLMDRGGMGFFPICGLEAPSGSGKTTGFFGFMNELSGCTAAAMVGTPAVIRNRMSAHRNVDVFVDDKNLPRAEAAALQEIFRNATGEGTMSKVDTRTNIEAIEQRIVGSALHAGEGLGIRSEKALLDRYLLLTITKPAGRKTVRRDKKNGEFQEQDVEEMRTRRLSKYSGWLVQRALEVRRSTVALQKELQSLSGSQAQRQGAKMRSLRYGARVLMDMFVPLKTPEDKWCQEVIDCGADLVLDDLIARVDAWCADVDLGYDPNANTLDSFLTDALIHLHVENTPVPGNNGWPITPMWVAPSKLWNGEKVIHFRFDYLIDWFKASRRFEQDTRVRNAAALKQQLEQSYKDQWKDSGAMRMKRPKDSHLDLKEMPIVRWIVLSPEATDRLYRLAELIPPNRTLL